MTKRVETFLPALPEAGGERLVDRPMRGLAHGAVDSDIAEQLLLGADLAEPLLNIARDGLAGDQAGAGVVDAEFCRALDLDRAGFRHSGQRRRRRLRQA